MTAKVDFPAEPGRPVEIAHPGGERVVHYFDQQDIDAIVTALASERPLLLRGEPGVGKSQLAIAAAIVLRRAYFPFVVDAQTEVRELRWTEDLVRRLADAQVLGALKAPAPGSDGDGGSDRLAALRDSLAIDNYTLPGPIWWGFDWPDATRQAAKSGIEAPAMPGRQCDPSNGVVVLIDEIDKADPELPNGLLEALGTRTFRPYGRSHPVTPAIWPLIVMTTNEERILPDAFIRRCIVRDLSLPDDPARLKDLLVERGQGHFPAVEPAVVAEAAGMLIADRDVARRRDLRPLPGQAEFLDLLRAFSRAGFVGDAEDVLARIRPYCFRKHPDWHRLANGRP